MRRIWKRYVTNQPDQYQVSISLPIKRGSLSDSEVYRGIERLEYVFEGRLNIYARTNRIAVVSDCVSAAQFDKDEFETALEQIESCYNDTHTIAHLKKWQRTNDKVTRTFVVVPVKPLFAARSTKNTPQAQSTIE